MKYRFLLDENILHFAINGVDEHDQRDDTSTTLVSQIGLNCHTILVNNYMLDRYWRQIRKIQEERARSRALEPVAFITQLLTNSSKWSLETEDCHELPPGIILPAEDIEIAKFAATTKAILITGDGDLRLGINAHPELGIRAITPKEALPYTSET